LRLTLAAPDENVFIEDGKKRASRHSIAALPQKPAAREAPAPCLDGILGGPDDMKMTSRVRRSLGRVVFVTADVVTRFERVSEAQTKEGDHET